MTFCAFVLPGVRSGGSRTIGRLLQIALLALIASVPLRANADPIPATVSLTVEPSGTVLTGIPYTYTGYIADLGAPPSTVPMWGRLLGSPGPSSMSTTNISFNSTFDMTIAFNGADGSHPSIDVQGTVKGYYDVTAIPLSSFLSAQGFNLQASLGALGTATSATLQGWTPASGIAMPSLSPYLNPAVYEWLQTGSGTGMASTDLGGGSFLSLDLSVPATVPEPTTATLYLTALTGAGLMRIARRKRDGR